MENKYQEALDKIRENLKELAGAKYYGSSDLAILKELVDKETPMKVVKWKLAQPETRCSKCGAGLERYHDYCWGCGRKVDWSDDDDSE